MHKYVNEQSKRNKRRLLCYASERREIVERNRKAIATTKAKRTGQFGLLCCESVVNISQAYEVPHRNFQSSSRSFRTLRRVLYGNLYETMSYDLDVRDLLENGRYELGTTFWSHMIYDSGPSEKMHGRREMLQQMLCLGQCRATSIFSSAPLSRLAFQYWTRMPFFI